MKFSKFTILFCIALLLSANTFAQKLMIQDVIPKDIFPDMFIIVRGMNIHNPNGFTYVLFSQGENVFKTHTGGGGRQDDGGWRAKVKVPKGLKPGVCQVIVEVEGNRSQPFTVNITETPPPPKLTSFSVPIANPGYFVWVEGNGFSYNQTLEMTDAEGQKFTEKIYGISSGNSLGFDIPKTAYPGFAKFKVVDNRNAEPLTSNEISLEIRRGALPLLVEPGWFIPLARGQWYELYTNDSRPLENADKIELKLTQGKKVKTLFISNYRRLYFQLPKSFKVGKMTVQNRTWIGNEVSEWSNPLEFEIAENSAAPTFHSVETIPSKAEAMFKQNGETIGILPVDFGILPRVRFPEKVQRGNLEIYIRYWDKGKFTDWQRKANFDDFNLEGNRHNDHPAYYKEKHYTFNPLFERLYFAENETRIFTAERGRNLVIYGDFFVKSTKDLKVTAENGRQKLSLQIKEHELLKAVIARLPEKMAAGDWEIWLTNKKTKSKVKLPVKVRLI